MQPIGSFKLRGAYNFIGQIPEDERSRGVITFSSGNHAQGVAYSARALGIPAVIVMPSNAPPVKIAATRALGAEIVFVGPASEERRERAEQLAAERGYTVVPPYDHPRIIAGQSTCGAEIAAQMPDVDLVLAPVSGGGLLSGTAAAIRQLLPNASVVGVEPELAADACQSFRTGERVTFSAEQTTRTIADGLRTQSVGAHNFELIQRFVDDIITVSEDDILDAMAYILREAHLLAEPSGAVAAAGWLFHRGKLPKAEKAVAVLSGGNAEDAALLAAMSRPPRAAIH